MSWQPYSEVTYLPGPWATNTSINLESDQWNCRVSLFHQFIFKLLWLVKLHTNNCNASGSYLREALCGIPLCTYVAMVPLNFPYKDITGNSTVLNNFILNLLKANTYTVAITTLNFQISHFGKPDTEIDIVCFRFWIWDY